MTILTAPGNESSVNNEMLFILQDAKALDPVTYPNYKYVLDIYVDSELKARLRATPDPTYSLGKFDVSVILRDYVPAYGLKADYDNATETYDIDVAYTCKLGEEYGDTLTTNLVTDSERTAFKTYAPRPLLSTNIISSKIGDIISNMPKTSQAELTGYKVDKWMLVPFYNNVSGVTISYAMYDSDNNIVGPGGGASYDLLVGLVMQENISFPKITTLLGLTQSEKDSVVKTVFSTDDSEYTIKYQCSKYPTVILAWLNPYGAYESQSFGLVSKKSNQINRKEFAQLPYQINASGVVSYDSNGVMYGSKKGYASSVKTSLALTSHLLTDDEYTWLADLFNSTDVYFFSTVLDRWVPCTIADSNYEYRTFKNSRLTPLQFSINFTDEYNAQYL